MLPRLDGVTLCRALRLDGASRDTPILMFTARDTESDKVLGLESGADDYVPKPFGIRELLARVEAHLRRQQRAGSGAAPAPRITAGALQVDVHKREATVHGKAVDLTRQEFDLLALLAARPGIVFSRGALLQQVWRGDAYVTERTVDTVVSRLRRKIERDPQNPALILTAWGYRLQVRRAVLIACSIHHRDPWITVLGRGRPSGRPVHDPVLIPLRYRLRQPHRKRRAPRPTLDANRAAVPLDDGARD
jgi:DNA-binding response OmpR family regulator